MEGHLTQAHAAERSFPIEADLVGLTSSDHMGAIDERVIRSGADSTDTVQYNLIVVNTLDLDLDRCIDVDRGIVNHPTKRVIDLCGAALLLVFFLPLLFIVAALVAIDQRGSVFFRQRRGGLGARPFDIIKFRTMRVCEDGDRVAAAQVGDPRITRLGAVLRQLSLDELPQLFNVLKGNMSLVGPRPHALAHDSFFAVQAPGYWKRFEVKPGITGLAQIRGQRGTITNTQALVARLESDIEYIDRWSIWLDLKILVESSTILFKSTGY